MGKRKSWIIIIWSFVALYIAFIWINSMQAGEIPLDVSTPIAKGISSILKADADKAVKISVFVGDTAHFLEYFCLAILFSLGYYLSFCKAMPGQKRGAVCALFVFLSLPSSFLTAIVDEGIQTITPGRNGNFGEVVFDSAAALAGAVVFFAGIVALHIIFTVQKKKIHSEK